MTIRAEDADYAGLWSHEPRSPGQVGYEVEYARRFLEEAIKVNATISPVVFAGWSG